jgi:SulP family sulfate permease
MLATFVATLFLPLQFAMLIGVALSFLLQILRMSNRIELREFELVEGGFPIERPAPAALGPGDVRVLRVRGSLFFASAQVLEPQLPQVDGARGTTLILLLRDVDDLGSTVIRLLGRYAAALRRAGGTSEELRGQLERTGLAAALGPGNIFLEQADLGVALNAPISAARARASAAAPGPEGA